jgi:hypothetical protein
MTITLGLVRQVYLMHWSLDTPVTLSALHAALAERGGFPELAYAAERLSEFDPDVELTIDAEGNQTLVIHADVRGLTYRPAADPADPVRTLVLHDGVRVGFVTRTPTGWSAWRQPTDDQPGDNVAYGQATMPDAAAHLIPAQRPPTG